MAGKPNTKMFATMVEKYGSEEAAREFFRTIGSRGGKARVPKGFATNREMARIAGAIGGSISRRGKKLNKD